MNQTTNTKIDLVLNSNIAYLWNQSCKCGIPFTRCRCGQIFYDDENLNHHIESIHLGVKN